MTYREIAYGYAAETLEKLRKYDNDLPGYVVAILAQKYDEHQLFQSWNVWIELYFKSSVMAHLREVFSCKGEKEDIWDNDWEHLFHEARIDEESVGVNLLEEGEDVPANRNVFNVIDGILESTQLSIHNGRD